MTAGRGKSNQGVFSSWFQFALGTRYTHEKGGSHETTQQIPALPKARTQPPAGITILLVVRVSIFFLFVFFTYRHSLQPVHWVRRDKESVKSRNGNPEHSVG